MVKIGGYRWPNQRAIRPNNSPLVTVAQNTLENTISRANQQLENALQVDGIQILIWLRSLGGSACSCSSSKTVSLSCKDMDKSPIVTTDDGYTMTPVRGYSDGYTGNLSDENGQVGVSDPQQEGINTVNFEEGLDFSPEELALLNMQRTELFTNDAVPCGICFGTGRTQGYSLFNGCRITLCASTDYDYTLVGGVSLNDAKPTGFTMSSSSLGAVVWKVELPTYYKACTSICIFNDRKLASNVTAEFSSDDGQTWNALTTANMMLYEGKPKNWLIRVTTIEKGDPVDFTHVVITLEGMDRCKGQTPNMEVSLNMETLDAPVTQNWVFPVNVPHLPRESVFYDSKYGYLWKVLSVEQEKTTNGQIFGYNVSARIVQIMEKFYPLKTSLQKTTDLAFRGMEAFQGSPNLYTNNEINKLDDKVRSFNWNTHSFDQNFSGFPGSTDEQTTTTDISTDMVDAMGTKWSGPPPGNQQYGDRVSYDNTNSLPGYFPLTTSIDVEEKVGNKDDQYIDEIVASSIPKPSPDTEIEQRNQVEKDNSGFIKGGSSD